MRLRFTHNVSVSTLKEDLLCLHNLRGDYVFYLVLSSACNIVRRAKYISSYSRFAKVILWRVFQTPFSRLLLVCGFWCIRTAILSSSKQTAANDCIYINFNDEIINYPLLRLTILLYVQRFIDIMNHHIGPVKIHYQFIMYTYITTYY